MRDEDRIKRAYDELVSGRVMPNFLFIGNGISHAAYFSAFALYAKEHGVDLRGIIYDAASSSRPNHFTESHILGINLEDSVFLRHDERGASKSMAASLGEMVRGCSQSVALRAPSHDAWHGDVGSCDSEEVFYFIYPAIGEMPAYALDFLSSIDRPVVRVVLEEGIGAYLMTSRDWWMLGAARERHPFMRVLKSAILGLLWPLQRRRQLKIGRRTACLPFTLFGISGDVAEKNSHVCACVSCVFDELAVAFDVPTIDYSNTVIIATTRFAELGAESFELTLLKEVVTVFQDMGLTVVLRPHPNDVDAERYGQLSVEIDDHLDVTLESLIAHSKELPVAILGFMSSSQLIANALWGVPAICISYVLGQGWAAAAEKSGGMRLLDRETQDAKELFSDYVMFPSSVAELEEAIAALGQEG